MPAQAVPARRAGAQVAAKPLSSPKHAGSARRGAPGSQPPPNGRPAFSSPRTPTRPRGGSCRCGRLLLRTAGQAAVTTDLTFLRYCTLLPPGRPRGLESLGSHVARCHAHGGPPRTAGILPGDAKGRRADLGAQGGYHTSRKSIGRGGERKARLHRGHRSRLQGYLCGAARCCCTRRATLRERNLAWSVATFGEANTRFTKADIADYIRYATQVRPQAQPA